MRRKNFPGNEKWNKKVPAKNSYVKQALVSSSRGDGMDVPRSLEKGSDVNYIEENYIHLPISGTPFKKFSPVTGIKMN